MIGSGFCPEPIGGFNGISVSLEKQKPMPTIRLMVLLLVLLVSHYQAAKAVVPIPGDSLRGTSYFEKAIGFYVSNPDSSAHYFQKASTPLLKANLFDLHVNCYNALHNLASQKGDFLSARKHAEKAFALASHHLSTSNKVFLLTRQNLGTLYLNEGLYLKASEVFNEILEIRLRNPKRDYLRLTVLLKNMGSLSRRQGDFSNAISTYELALTYTDSIASTANQFSEKISILVQLGNVYNQYEIAQSIIYYKQVIRLLNDHKMVGKQSILLDCFNKIANYHLKGFDTEKAQVWLNKAKELIDAQGPSLTNVENTWIYFSELSNQQGDFLASKRYLQKAQAVIASTTSLQSIDKRFPYIHRLLAKNAESRGDFEEAQNQILQSLRYQAPGIQSFEQPVKPEQFVDLIEGIRCLETKAGILESMYLKTGEITLLKRSLDTYLVIVQMIDELKSTYRNTSAKLFLSNEVVIIYKKALNVVYKLYEHSPIEEYLDKAVLFMEQNKASVLYQTMMERKTNFGLPDSLQEQENIYRSYLDQYRNRLLAFRIHQGESDSAELIQLREKVLFFEGKLNELHTTIHKHYPVLFQRKYRSRFPAITEIRNKLNAPEQAFMEYFRGEEFLYLLIVTRKETAFQRYAITEQLKGGFLPGDN